MTHRRLPVPTLLEASDLQIQAALAGDGLWLDLGLASMRVRSDEPSLAAQIKAAYRHFPFEVNGSWADLHCELQRARGLRRWWRPQVHFFFDGRVAFDPFPADHALPLMEWSANWLIGRRLNDVLLLHAGVLEREGCALVMPAIPGSGKSTLTAALALNGWRLLSDEFGALDTTREVFLPVLKPVALKNESIEVVRAFGARAELGPSFPYTRKGTVAHLAPPPGAVAARHEGARPGAVVLPRFEAGSPTRLMPLDAGMTFNSLSFNAFNYAVLGRDGFDAVVTISQRCPGWQLIYGDLAEALQTLADLWPDVVARVSS